MHQFKRGDTPVDFTIIKRKYANWDSFIGSPQKFGQKFIVAPIFIVIIIF